MFGRRNCSPLASCAAAASVRCAAQRRAPWCKQAEPGRHEFPVSLGRAVNWRPLCPRPRDERNRDASLSAPAARARRSAARHAEMLRGSCTGSAPRPDAAIRAGDPPHTRRRSTGYRDHSHGKSVPGARSTRNCRADSSLRPPSCPPHPALDNAVRCWHKGNANAPSCARARRRPGVLSRNVPGPSLIRRPRAG